MKDFLQIGIVYSFVKYLVMGMGVIKSFYIAAALGPSFLGSYAVILLVVEYLNYSNLGVYASMNRDAAIHMDDHQKREYVEKIINVALSFTIIPIALLLIGYLSTELIELDFLPNEVKDYSLMILILVAFHQLKIFSFRYLRLYSKFYQLTSLEFLGQVINLSGVILFIDAYSLNAVLWSVIASNIFFSIVAFFYVKGIKLRLDFSIIKYLIISGFPMLVYAVFLSLLSSVDRIVIASSFGSRTPLGYYQFAFTGAHGLFLVFNSITILFYPKWLKYFYEEENSTGKLGAIKEQSLIIELILAFLSIIGIIFIPFFINLLLPEYAVSILITQLLLLAFIGNGLTFITSTFLIANNHQIKIVPVVIVVISSALVMNYLFISLGYGLYGIAFSTIVAFFAYAFALTFLTLNLSNSLSLFNLLFFYKRLIIFIPLATIFLYEKFDLVWILLLFAIIYFNLAKDLMIKFLKTYRSSKLN